MRPPSASFYGGLFGLALLALGAEILISFPFYFAPGWANGWPGGLTIYQVWSTWLTLTLYIILMTCGIGVGSLISLFLSAFPSGRRHAGIALVAWIDLWVLLSVVTCLWAFPEVYASTLEMWPQGYPGVSP
jgi:hypothetical protein